MQDYCAYGLNFRSELLLPELVEASDAHAAPAPRQQGNDCVVIRLAPIPHWPGDGEMHAGSAWATSEAAFLLYPGVARFLIRGGREITIDAEAGVEERLIRLFLLGPALALLLHQRRFLVLHASAVRLGDGAVAFVAEKGMGKSTLAAALHARGHALVADDIVAIDTSGPSPLAYPGFPQLKLFPESAALLDADPAKLPRVHPDFDKRARKTIEGFPTHPLPLWRVFVLADGDAHGVEALPGRLGFMELVRHSYLLAFLNATGSAATHFRQTISVAARVPVSRLLRRRSLEVLPDLAKLVERDIERAA